MSTNEPIFMQSYGTDIFSNMERKEKQDPYHPNRKVLYQIIQVHAFVVFIVILQASCTCANGQNQMPEESG